MADSNNVRGCKMPTSAKLTQLRNEYNALQDRQQRAMEQWHGAINDTDSNRGEAWDAVTEYSGSRTDKADAINETERKLEELNDRILQEVAVAKAEDRFVDGWKQNADPSVPHIQPGNERKDLEVYNNLGTYYVEHPDIRKHLQVSNNSIKNSPAIVLPIVNNLFRTGDGAPAASERVRGIHYQTGRPLRVTDLIPAQRTATRTITFLRESTYSGTPTVLTEPATHLEPGTGSTTPAQQDALRTASLGYAPDLDIDTTEVTSACSVIGAFLRVTEQQLRDVQEVAEYINTRGTNKMETAIAKAIMDSQATNNLGFHRYGTGTAHNQMQTQAQGSDQNADAIYKAMYKVRSTGAQVTAIVCDPAVVAHLMLERINSVTANTDNRFLFSTPPTDGMRLPAIWGAPIVEEGQVDSGEAVVGDFVNGCVLRVMQDVVMEHGPYLDNFRRFIQAIRWSVDFALTVWQPQEFCTITGLDKI